MSFLNFILFLVDRTI